MTTISVIRTGNMGQAIASVAGQGGNAGSLKRAREMEAIGLLQISLAANQRVPRTGGFGIVG